jgi:hypothetical protein
MAGDDTEAQPDFPDHIPHPGWRAKVIYDPDEHSKIAILDDTLSWGEKPTTTDSEAP